MEWHLVAFYSLAYPRTRWLPVLDLGGFISIIGDIGDGINALWYMGEAIYYGVTGNHELAQQSLKYSIASFVCAIPAIGSFVGQGMKLTIKGVDVGATIIRGSRLVGYGTSFLIGMKEYIMHKTEME